MTVPFDARSRRSVVPGPIGSPRDAQHQFPKGPRLSPQPTQRRTQTNVRASGNSSVRPGAMWWSPHAIGMAVVITIIVAVGLVFVASSSSVMSLNRYGSSWYIFRRQVQWVGLGVLCMSVSVVIPYQRWQRFAFVLFGLTWVATFSTLIVGISRNGSKRWIGPDSIALQPSESLKFATIIGLASLFLVVADKPDRDRLLTHQVLVAGAVILGPVALQPDMGTMIILAIILLAMTLYVGLAARDFAKIGAFGASLALLFAVLEPYRRDRLLAFRHPERDLDGIGYHVMQSKLGFASGRLFGVGVGASKAKWGFLPNSHTDFIFAIIGEELGLVGAGLVLFLFLGLAFLGMQTARRAPDRFGALVAVGITAWLFSQAIINMGAVVGALPVTGVPLPLISVGGSSFVVLMAALGVLLNIARSGRRVDASSRRNIV